MAQSPNNLAEAPIPAVAPLASLAYATPADHSFSSAVRALGLASILLAALGLARTPLLLFSASRQFRGMSNSTQNYYIAVFLISLVVQLGASILQMVAGVKCFRLRRSAMRLLRIWAWIVIIEGGISLAANVYFLFQSRSRLSYSLLMLSSIFYFAERWAVSITVPIFVLVLTRTSAFRQGLRSGD